MTELYSTRLEREYNERARAQGNRPTDNRTHAKLPTDEQGYVLGAECQIEHGGNRRLSQDGAWCQCAGCGSHVSTVHVWETVAR